MKKPIWYEGVILSQQHFQLWDQCFDESFLYRSKWLNPYYWGFASFEVDQLALEANIYRIKRCSGVFPNGQIFIFDSENDGELCYALTENDQLTSELYLCLPLNQKINGLSGYDDGGECAWKAKYENFRDQYDSAREREIAYRIPQLKILSNYDQRDAYAQIKITKSIINSKNHFKIDREYIFTVTEIQSSPALRIVCDEIVQSLMTKNKKLMERYGYYKDIGKFFINEAENFLMMQAIHQSIGVLWHIKQQKNVHPYFLYIELIRLSQRINFLSNENTNIKFPDYDHEDLTKVFHDLYQMIKRSISAEICERTFKLNLEQKNEGLYFACIANKDIFEKYNLYLTITKKESLIKILNMSHKIKIASQNDIQDVINSALPAVEIKYIQRGNQPKFINGNLECYLIEKKGHYWDHIIEEKNLFLFVHDDVKDSKFEIIASRDAY